VADSRRWNAPKAVLVLLIGTACIQKALPALVAVPVVSRGKLPRHQKNLILWAQAIPGGQNAWRCGQRVMVKPTLTDQGNPPLRPLKTGQAVIVLAC